MSQARLQHLRIGLHELSVSAGEMSPLGTAETKCCSRRTDVKYCLEVILNICSRRPGVAEMGGVWHRTLFKIPGMLRKVSVTAALLTAPLTGCKSIHFPWPLIMFRVTASLFQGRATPRAGHKAAEAWLMQPFTAAVESPVYSTFTFLSRGEFTRLSASLSASSTQQL